MAIFFFFLYFFFLGHTRAKPETSNPGNSSVSEHPAPFQSASCCLLIPPLTYSRSYCERVFRDCRLQTCYVQSPAYPGVYPRGLHCRYHLNTRLPFVKLYIENEEFNIDGQRCENIMTCPMRPISSGEKHCPFDYIKIYDGVNEGSPVIGKA